MKNKQINQIQYILLSIVSICFVLPLIWLVLASLDTNASQALAFQLGGRYQIL